MTDATGSQLASVTVTSENADAQIAQFALVTVVKEIAFEANVSALAIISVDVEFTLPQIKTPFSCGQFLQTMPYFVGEFN